MSFAVQGNQGHQNNKSKIITNHDSKIDDVCLHFLYIYVTFYATLLGVGQSCTTLNVNFGHSLLHDLTGHKIYCDIQVNVYW